MSDEVAVRFARTGGAEVLQLEPVAVAPPGAGEVRLRHTAIGVNFIDTYHRSGLYPVALPSGIGVEGAGVVEALGAGVEGLRIGDRVAYCLGPLGSYASARTFAADRLVRLPDTVDEEAAAAVTLKGLTAWYLLHRTRVLRPGETILVQAAAGGVGTILCQWAHHLGARVIGTVGSHEKARIARDSGADEVIHYREEDVAARVRELTGGTGVPVVYDAVGAATFDASLAALAPMGLMVSFGNASGPAPAVTPLTLMDHGSLFLTRPQLGDYLATPGDLAEGAAALFGLVADGVIRPHIGQRFALDAAAEAHRALESRATVGSTILLPSG